jgi:hypothetical protein
MNRLLDVILGILRLLESQRRGAPYSKTNQRDTSEFKSELLKIQTTIEQIRTEADAQRRKQDEHLGIERKRLRIETGTFVIVVIGAFAALANLWLFGSGLQESRRSADAATEATAIARESLVSVQRAFVSHAGYIPEYRLFRTKTGVERFIEFRNRWENSGTTPALSVVQYFAIEQLPDEPTDDQFRGQPERTHAAYIRPGGDLQSNLLAKPETFFTTPMSATSSFDQTKVVRSQRRIFLWGWIGYRDIFPTSKVHITEFCQRVTRVLATGPPGAGVASGITFNTVICSDRHNCVDEQCADYKRIAALVPPRQSN